ncbi:MAG TPA: endolytic transglycosylase MltG, partial [Myxococcaceae bacterium]|nr:endolytic transglycosylase MltG [Myxococcaceae bacterium]
MKKVLIALGVLVVMGAAAAGGWWWLRQQRVTEFASKPFGSDVAKTVEIPPGTGPHALGALLARAEVVSSADDFYQLIRREQAAPKLKAGEYEFKGALAPTQILEKLIKGEVKLYHFTVPEGLRADEIFDILANSELKLDRAKLVKLAESKAFLKKAGVPSDRIEGFLYPDTYSFTRGADEEAVLSKMVSRTLEEYRK